MSLNTILATAPLTSTGFHLKANGTTLGNSLIWDNGTNVGIGNQGTTYTLDVSGTGRFTGALTGTTTFTLDGTKKVYLRSAQPAASGLLSGSALAAEGNFSIYSDSGVAAEILGMYYWNGSTYRSALQFANVSSGSSNLILMKDGGNVGIGTSSPSGLLSLEKAKAGSGVESLDMLNVRLTGTTAIGDALNFNFLNGTNTNIAKISALLGADNVAYGTLTFSTRNYNTDSMVEAMRITNKGYTKMTNSGTYNSVTGIYHEMVQSINNYQSATISHIGSSPYGLEVNFANADPNNATNWGLGFYSASPSFVWIYRIYSNGTVAARSDARWKKNIETTRNGYLEDLCKLRVVKYNWYNHEEDAPKELGLIAQEVEEVFPNLISYDKVTTKKQVEQEDGTFIEEEFEDGESRSVKISVLPFMLLKGLQEAMTKIEEQQIQIQSLQEQINILAK